MSKVSVTTASSPATYQRLVIVWLNSFVDVIHGTFLLISMRLNHRSHKSGDTNSAVVNCTLRNSMGC